ncbi:NAD(P)/FAD-dependent oxidoreductase [Saccharibacillus deserti]|uniref:NAD(P)/FAD-dependent oxidoreductase n=1 Tax=Saccharibacillus deserti TaxID=1634444 RepID=UPI0015536B7F|nr:NAD(P)/FAD-dependent oxidoreductase [Saccharibacillus deserti]
MKKTKTNNEWTDQADVVIVGGGPAGLSAALVLGRARRSVLVIDEALPRHRVTGHSHGFLTRDGIEPEELRRISQEQIAKYPSVRFVQGRVVEAAGSDGDFRLTTGSSDVYRAEKLLFAVGMKDLPIGIEGLEDVYGKSAYVCPYCDGWEMQDRPIGILAQGDAALHLTRTVTGWSDDIALFTNGEVRSDTEKEELRSKGVEVYEAAVRRIVSAGGQTQRIILEDGTDIPRTAIFFAPKLAPGSELPAKLGCDTMESGAMAVDELCRSSVSGIFGAGDGASQRYQVAAAVAAGSTAGAVINSELLERDWKLRGAESRIL